MSILPEPEERIKEKLTLGDVRSHCMFELIMFIPSKNSSTGEAVERKIFCKAWRKVVEPRYSLDNSGYPIRDRKYSSFHWTLQYDTYEWRTPGWDTLIKENRSDKVIMDDFNSLLEIPKKYPGVKAFLFSQGYPDKYSDDDYVEINRIPLPSSRRDSLYEAGRIAEDERY